MVLVDTREPSRLGPFRYAVGNPVQLHIYDHHPPTQRPSLRIWAGRTSGASVTVLLRSCARGPPGRAFGGDPVLLGLYEETGCLTFPHTTQRMSDGGLVAGTGGTWPFCLISSAFAESSNGS